MVFYRIGIPYFVYNKYILFVDFYCFWWYIICIGYREYPPTGGKPGNEKERENEGQ
jgi:hypothetical protein